MADEGHHLSIEPHKSIIKKKKKIVDNYKKVAAALLKKDSTWIRRWTWVR